MSFHRNSFMTVVSLIYKGVLANSGRASWVWTVSGLPSTPRRRRCRSDKGATGAQVVWPSVT